MSLWENTAEDPDGRTRVMLLSHVIPQRNKEKMNVAMWGDIRTDWPLVTAEPCHRRAGRETDGNCSSSRRRRYWVRPGLRSCRPPARNNHRYKVGLSMQILFSVSLLRCLKYFQKWSSCNQCFLSYWLYHDIVFMLSWMLDWYKQISKDHLFSSNYWSIRSNGLVVYKKISNWTWTLKFHTLQYVQLSQRTRLYHI